MVVSPVAIWEASAATGVSRVGLAIGLGLKVGVGSGWVVVGVTVAVGNGVLVGVAGDSGVWVEATDSDALVGADVAATGVPTALGSIRP